MTATLDAPVDVVAALRQTRDQKRLAVIRHEAYYALMKRQVAALPDDAPMADYDAAVRLLIAARYELHAARLDASHAEEAVRQYPVAQHQAFCVALEAVARETLPDAVYAALVETVRERQGVAA